MPKVKPVVLISAVVLVGSVFCAWIGLSQAPQPSVRLATTPAISEIRPYEAEATALQSPVQLTLQAVDATGHPVENAKLHLQLLAPPKTPWLTTDFPIVEGTPLLDMEAVAPKGELQVEQMLPIRGTYRLLVNVTPSIANAFAPFQQTLSVSVVENGVKWQNFAILAVMLLATGVLGGWVIGGRQPIQPGEIAPQRVRLLLSGAIVVAIAALLYINISAEMEQSQHAIAMSHPTEMAASASHPNQRQVAGLAVQLSGDHHAVVGQLASFQVQVTDAKTQQPATDVIARIKATQMEDGWVAFAHRGTPDATGRLQWQEQFFDGAPHQVEVEIAPQADSACQFQPFQVAHTLEVEGVAPPLSVRLITLSYMTGIVTIGLLLGLKLQRKRSYQAR